MDEKYMKIALNLATEGEGKVNPNPLVGAVVVKDNKIIGSGYHKYYGGPHAEVYALQEAGENANGADIYVTLEPCSHYGKTPPCCDAIINAGIKRCIIAMKDPNPLVCGRGIKKMQEAGIEVISGIMEKESQSLNKIFIKYITTKIPYVFLKTAITMDGKIATKTGDSKWISNEEAREEVQVLRNKYMGIMVGINTVISDNPRLTSRIANGVDPYRIIIDPNLKIDDKYNIIKNNKDKKTIVVTSEKNIGTQKYLMLKGYDVDFITMKGFDFKILEILKKLGEKSIDSILIEGGSKVISKVIKEKVLDEGVLFIAPKIVGDSSAVSIVSGMDTINMCDAIKLKNPTYEIYQDNIAVYFEGIE